MMTQAKYLKIVVIHPKLPFKLPQYGFKRAAIQHLDFFTLGAYQMMMVHALAI